MDGKRKDSKMMSREAFDAIATRFRVLSDPMRLEILHQIGADEVTVSELVVRTGGSQSNVSKHLATLLTHGLVRRRREGTSAFYSITEMSIFELCDQVCGGIEQSLASQRRALQ